MSVELPDRAVVRLGDNEVGVLRGRGDAARFEPSQEWAELPAGTRPILGQQFEEDPFAAYQARYGAPEWFEHLLPEHGGPLRDAVARSLDIAPERSLALLVALGDELPGAVRIEPVGDEPSFLTVARRERGGASLPASDPSDQPMRVSLAGLQFKISARLGKRGIALPAHGEEGDWILKFADQRFATLPENEFVVMSWAQAAGLNVPEVRLEETARIAGLDAIGPAAGTLAFAIRRYDRADGARIHQEDFAQALGLPPGDSKYNATNIDTIVRVLNRLAPEDTDELISRLVFCVLCGNDDAHAKNWSLWYPDPTRPRLSPGYDLVSTVEYYPRNDMSLKLARARRFGEVGRGRFRLLARRAGLDPEHVDGVVVEAVKNQVEAWSVVREWPQVSDALRELIDQRLETLRLVGESR